MNTEASSSFFSGISSLRRSLSRVSGAKCRLSIPPTATEMEPVSSETMATTASVCSLAPIPARWRMPNSLERFTFPDMGSIHPAPTILPSRTMTAPSWRGALFQKIFFNNSLLTTVSSLVPVRIASSSILFRSKTIKAPVLLLESSA